MTVKRYRVRCKSGVVTLDPHGAWVDYNDYVALESKNEILDDGLIKAGEHTIQLGARLAEAVAALQAFSDYLGPLEYNRILALGITVSASGVQR